MNLPFIGNPTDKLKILGLLGSTALAGIGVIALTFTLMSVKGDLKRTTADRDWLQSWAESVCVAVGAPLEASKGHKRGDVCRATINGLISFKTQAAVQTSTILVKAEAARVEKTNAHIGRVRVQAKRAETAKENMEKADAAVVEDRVGDEWFGALSDLAGLRPRTDSPAAPADSGSGGGEGHAPGGHVAVRGASGTEPARPEG